MSILAGTRFGPYEILAPLGAGGMGEVYRARDTRLNREVAIKVLPAALRTSQERLWRFEEEARAASALNHPGIVTIHDIGESDSGSYIAMELVEGLTLREVLVEGPLPTKRLLSIAAQVADGLARAHEAGIVHRDLKPENIMITRDGFVKILDFGLAKLTQPPEDPRGATEAPTAPAATQPGVVMGTVGFMSPEQAVGKPLDFRSDQFSFGSIVYEMATGKRAFARPTVPETLAAIIREEPEPIGTLAPLVPAPLRWIVERCIAKRPEERYASTRDLARDLATLKEHLSEASGLAPAAVSAAPDLGRRLRPWIAASGLLLLGLLLGLLLPRADRKASTDGVIRFSVDAPEGASFGSGEVMTKSAISPDGRTVAIVALSQGRQLLYLRSLDSLSARALSGTEMADSPFWSPDSRSIAFFAEGKLKKIDATGGPPQTLCDASFEGTGSWSREGRILFAEAAPGREGIHSIPVGGGPKLRLTVPDAARKERFHLWPRFLPDGRHFLYVALLFGGGPAHEVRIASLDSKETASLGVIDSRVEYALPGFLLFVREGTLLARPFDAKALRWTGDARPLVEGLHYFYGPANAGFSASQNGVLSYERGTVPTRVVWVDRGGKETSGLAGLERVQEVRLSPDGRKAALAVSDARFGTSDIWVFDIVRGVSTRLTSEPTDEIRPVWSADGRRVVFRSDRNGPPDIYEISSGGGDAARPVLEGPGVEAPQDSAPDGRSLLYSESNRSTGEDLWLFPLSAGRKPIPFLRTRFDEDQARYSPDGHWVAYDSTESGSAEIYVTSRDGSSGRVRVSTAGGHSPRWRRGGRELFYMAPGRRVMAVTVKLVRPGGIFDAGAPVELFRISSAVYSYDAAPDGQRFLMVEPVKEPGPPITVVTNWPALLGR